VSIRQKRRRIIRTFTDNAPSRQSQKNFREIAMKRAEAPHSSKGERQVLLKVFGPEMLSGRVVLGVASLPLGLPVEVELVLESAA
jgi:hypothetical protein